MFEARVAIGIPAYNEERNIQLLLSRIIPLIGQCIDDVLIVSSSTDDTDCLVRAFQKTCPQIHLLHTPRQGKASAWNLLIRHAETLKTDVLIYIGADNAPANGAIQRLLLKFADASVGIVTGRPETISGKRAFLTWCATFQWNLHHLISENFEPKISGELCAMRVGVVREMPPAIINDDVYLQDLFKLKGYATAYASDAVVFLQGPKNLHDLVSQRYRIYLGHHQMRFLLGQKPATVQYRSIKYLIAAMPDRFLSSYVYLVADVFLQSYAYLRAKIGVMIGDLPYKWKMIDSTKELRFGV